MTIRSRRKECKTGDCIYRFYTVGPTQHAAYFYRDNTSDIYAAAPLNLSENGQYELFVILEGLKNATMSKMKDVELEFIRKKGRHCVAERISRLHSIFNVSTEDNVVNQLPKCRYTSETLESNAFEWVDRSILEHKYGLTPKETLMIPSKNLDPTRNLAHFVKNHKKHPEWYQPFQKYVWHSSSCVQKWIEPSMIYNLASRVGKLKIVTLGTSRIRDTNDALNALLMNTGSKKSNHSNSLTEIVHVFNGVKTSIPKLIVDRIQQVMDEKAVCLPEMKNDPNAPTL